MKQTKLFLITLLCIVMSTAAFADDKPIKASQLPAAAQTFVKKHFPKNKIAYAEKDWRSYEVKLDNGVELDFDSKGSWTKVDGENNAIPAAVIPEAIRNYAKKNYPNIPVVKIEKKSYGYQIELANDIDLKFNKQGKFLSIDR